MAAISQMLNITGLTVSMYKLTNKIKLLINPVSANKGMIFESFHRYQLHLERLYLFQSKDIY